MTWSQLITQSQGELSHPISISSTILFCLPPLSSSVLPSLFLSFFSLSFTHTHTHTHTRTQNRRCTHTLPRPITPSTNYPPLHLPPFIQTHRVQSWQVSWHGPVGPHLSPSFFPQKAKCQRSGEEAILSLQLPKQDAALGFLSPKEMKCSHCFTGTSEGEHLFYGFITLFNKSTSGWRWWQKDPTCTRRGRLFY